MLRAAGCPHCAKHRGLGKTHKVPLELVSKVQASTSVALVRMEFGRPMRDMDSRKSLGQPVPAVGASDTVTEQIIQSFFDWGVQNTVTYIGFGSLGGRTVYVAKQSQLAPLMM